MLPTSENVEERLDAINTVKFLVRHIENKFDPVIRVCATYIVYLIPEFNLLGILQKFYAVDKLPLRVRIYMINLRLHSYEKQILLSVDNQIFLLFMDYCSHKGLANLIL